MATKKKTKRTKKTSKSKTNNKPTQKKPGIIATIVSVIEDAGAEGVSKDQILEALTKEFPDRSPDSMKNTINTQVPYRISKERFAVENKDGKYRKKNR